MLHLLSALLVLAAGDPAAEAPAGNKPAAAPAKPAFDPSKLPFTEYSIKEVVKYHTPDIQSCYEGVIAEVKKNPPEGTVVVAFTITANGFTADTKVDKKKSTIKNERVQDCVTDEVRKWEFPKPTDNRDHPIVYPFSLKVTK